MRHAEKTGEKSDPHLSREGTQRAERLATYIPQQFGTPQFLVAAATSERSRRPRETLEPLAVVSGLEIMDRFDDEEVDPLIGHLRSKNYSGKFGVISWRHSDIPRLVAALGAPRGTYPSSWDETEYDLIIVMNFPETGRPIVSQVVEPF